MARARLVWADRRSRYSAACPADALNRILESKTQGYDHIPAFPRGRESLFLLKYLKLRDLRVVSK
jgi:hypothetical protein